MTAPFLPPNFSVHGQSIDRLYAWVFWITAAVFLIVHVLLITFLIRYRRRADKPKARFTHGNLRVEIVWTIIPVLILAGISIASKRIWDEYRFSPDLDDPSAAHVMVIARQFNWNAIYAGPDRKVGRYVVYPRPGDATWPAGPGGKSATFASVAGPAMLPREEVQSAITRYIAQNNPFGKVYDPKLSPEGVDDIPSTAVSKIELPVNRPTVFEITSLDVIHDFYLPNFRVNVYAVPGMTVKVAMTPTMTSKQKEKASMALYDVDRLAELIHQPAAKEKELAIDIDETSPGDASMKEKDKTGYRYFASAGSKKTTIIRDGAQFNDASLAGLKKLGLKQVKTHLPGYWEIVCAQLCGIGHSAMEGRIYVLDQAEWSAKYERRNESTKDTKKTEEERNRDYADFADEEIKSLVFNLRNLRNPCCLGFSSCFFVSFVD